jgi:hypothetical protein
MEVYQAEEKFILAVTGGQFYTLSSQQKAMILNERPVPTKWWTVPRFKDKTLSKGDTWNVDTEFREFLCDGEKVYILKFDYHRTEPGYCKGVAEFFVTGEFAKEKIASFRKHSRVREYYWDPTVPTWNEILHKKYYRNK